ncbi:hypothetical protein LCGC14_2630610 [marine sediment metagenome]|uniref:Uncharacterized protein n=1 Tax=marine sediment metagenome TaxID=412755 RepID=A0A0F9CST1_9ZZZZ
MKKKRKPPAKLCGANKTDGSGKCKQPAGWGTGTGRGRCKKHGGNTRAHKVKAQREAAEEAVAVYGLPIEIDPTDALLEEVWRSSGIVRYLDQVIRAKTPDELAAKPSLVIWHLQERRHYVAVSVAAIRAGIEAKRVALAERHGVMCAQVIRAVFEEKGIADDADVPAMVRRHLTSIDGGKA